MFWLLIEGETVNCAIGANLLILDTVIISYSVCGWVAVMEPKTQVPFLNSNKLLINAVFAATCSQILAEMCFFYQDVWRYNTFLFERIFFFRILNTVCKQFVQLCKNHSVMTHDHQCQNKTHYLSCLFWPCVLPCAVGGLTHSSSPYLSRWIRPHWWAATPCWLII